MNGLLGVIILSGSLPATRVAVADFDPLFLTAARAAIAGTLGLGMLLAAREERPTRKDLAQLIVVALGVVVGFPLLTALALIAWAGWTIYHVGESGWLVYLALGLAGVFVYFPWRSAKTKKLWLGHYERVKQELDRRHSGDENHA